MKIYLVTGSTGAIGARLVPMLLEDEDVQVRLLIRADSPDHLEARFKELAHFWEIPLPHERVKSFRGDVTLPKLGLAVEDYAKLVGECTHVIHSAGSVRMNLPLDEARRTAVGGAKNIAHFAEECLERGNLKKLEFISTVGVGGRMKGAIPETWITEKRSFHNTYEEAKAEAEEFIRTKIAQGLPVTVHRPSMVVGDSQTGKIVHFQVFYHLCEFLSGRKTRGFLPALGDARLDIIPVDYVARAIVWASGRVDSAGKIFNLCSGPDQSIRLTELRQIIELVFRSRGLSIPAVHFLPRSLFNGCLPLIGALVPASHKKALRSLPFFLDYLKEAQHFENGKTGGVLGVQGIVVLHTPNYIGRILEYYLEQKKSRRG